MKLISWNVNGLRACLGKGFYRLLCPAGRGFFLFAGNQDAASVRRRSPPGLRGVFQFSREKKAPGTAILARQTPLSGQNGHGQRSA